MCRIVIVLFLFVGNISFGQIKSSVDVLGGINVSFRIIDDNGSAVEMVRNETETPKSNYHLGFNFNLRIASKLNLKTGLRLASLGYKTQERVLTFSTGEMTRIQFFYDYLFLEIPVTLRYEFSNDNTLKPFVEMGISPTYYATNRVVKIQDEEEETTYERNPSNTGFKTFHLTGNVAVGLNYYLSEETCLFFQFNYKHHLTNLVNTDFKEHLWSYGGELGIRRSISE